MQTARLFIALIVPPKNQRAIAAGITELQLPHDSIRLVIPHQLHLTLKFLGTTPIQDIPDIITCLEQVQIPTDFLTLQTSHLLLLPKRRPSVVALRIEP